MSNAIKLFEIHQSANANSNFVTSLDRTDNATMIRQ